MIKNRDSAISLIKTKLRDEVTIERRIYKIINEAVELVSGCRWQAPPALGPGRPPAQAPQRQKLSTAAQPARAGHELALIFKCCRKASLQLPQPTAVHKVVNG